MSHPHQSGPEGQWQQGPDGQWHKTPPGSDRPVGGTPGPTDPGPGPTGAGHASTGAFPGGRFSERGQSPVRGGSATAGEEQGWGVAMHLGGVFLSWLVPLVLWLVFRQRSRMLDDHGREALNFQITLFIAYVVGWATAIILVGFVILFITWVLSIIFSIMAAIAAYNRQPYRYPLTIRFIS